MEFEQNWARVDALTARGEGVELGERRSETKWSPAACRRPWLRRSGTVVGGSDDAEGEERKEFT